MSWKPREERVSRRRGWDICVECCYENKNSAVNIRLTLTGAISRYRGDKVQLKLRENHNRRMHRLRVPAKCFIGINTPNSYTVLMYILIAFLLYR